MNPYLSPWGPGWDYPDEEDERTDAERREDEREAGAERAERSEEIKP